MDLQRFSNLSFFLAHIYYIKSNFLDGSKEFKKNLFNQLSVQSNSDLISYVKISKEVLLENLKNNDLDLKTKTLFLTFSGAYPPDEIFDFFYGIGGSYSYSKRWVTQDNSPSLFIKMADEYVTDSAFHQLSGLEFKGTKMFMSRVRDYDLLTQFEQGLLGHPDEEEVYGNLVGFFKKTQNGLLALSIDVRSGRQRGPYDYHRTEGNFTFTDGTTVQWYVDEDKGVCMWKPSHRYKISQEELKVFCSMLEQSRQTLPCGLLKHEQNLKWNKVSIL